uniref:Uncharacterized protein n=1 Tax=Arundo donax TaxID=35708 RepID=A0A0A9FZV6_ARUDO
MEIICRSKKLALVPKLVGDVLICTLIMQQSVGHMTNSRGTWFGSEQQQRITETDSIELVMAMILKHGFSQNGLPNG